MTSTRLSSRTRPVSHRPRHSHTRQRRRSRLSRSTRIWLFCTVALAAILIWAIAARAFAPLTNTNSRTFDTIIVLGTPADSDGNPTPELLDRITEGVHEYERGVAPRIIVTGGAAHNHFVEAEVMAHIAQSQGVPGSVIFQETKARDTIQNACYSADILKTHGWHSTEVISSASHLPRASMIFSHLPIEKFTWRMHAAPNDLTPPLHRQVATVLEVVKTARYLLWSRWIEKCDG